MSSRSGVRNPSSRITITEIPLQEIRIPEYQRLKINQLRVRDIVANYDPALDEPMTVVPERNGTYSLTDGQHKFLAKTELGHRTATCRVVSRAGQQQQAEYFLDLNQNRSGINPMDKFRASLIKGDTESAEIDKAIRSRGFRVSGTEGRERPIVAVGALRFAYGLGGPDLVAETLEIIAGAWPDDKEGTKAYYLQGVSQFLHVYGNEIDKERLRMRLAATRPLSLQRQGKEMSAFTGPQSRAAGMARAIAMVYNYRLGPDRRLELVI